ncbi:MAG TPA: hypothetical protein VF433_05860, partial [Cellvibrio sp.]
LESEVSGSRDPPTGPDAEGVELGVAEGLVKPADTTEVIEPGVAEVIVEAGLCEATLECSSRRHSSNGMRHPLAGIHA